jgi:hypothetical protein
MVRAVVDQQARSLTSVAIFFRNFAFFKVFKQRMIKHILLLAAVIGFIAQSSIYAADPTPAPTATASPSKAHHGKKHHKKSETPEASPSPKAG